MPPRKYMIGLFSDEASVVSALKDLKRSRFHIEDVHSPVPSEAVLEILERPGSRVGYFTLAGGILGFFTGIGLSIYTAVQWGLIVGGKPVVALVPFFIVGFEFTVLFAVFGNVIGLLIQARLPGFKPLEHYDPRCSGDRFGILASCGRGEEAELMTFFRERGGDIKSF